MRDLSAGAKYRLPWLLPANTRLALGATDLGGAATNFRSYYGVATSSLGALDLSLGYGKGSHAYPSLNGAFGSAQWALSPQWRLLAEYDTRELRAGVRHVRPLTDDLSLELGASRKLSQRSEQQAWQASAGLSYSFDGKARRLGALTGYGGAAPSPAGGAGVAANGVSTGGVAAGAAAGAAVTGGASAGGAASGGGAASVAAAGTQGNGAAARASATGQALPATGADAAAQRAGQLAQRLRERGFNSVSVGFDDAAAWVVRAEPVNWRKNRLDALGVALAAWRELAGEQDRLRLTLTYLQDGVLGASTSAACLAKFAQGSWWCDGAPALALNNGESAAAPQRGWLVEPNSRWDALRPQFEMGPTLRHRVGTEYGLYDFSAGVDLGWELPLARGLLWQGLVTVPVTQTHDFDEGQVFGADRLQRRLESSSLSYQYALAPRLWAQASAGYLFHGDRGEQLDLAWLSPDGRWRLGAMTGSYRGASTRGWALDEIVHPTTLASVRWSAIPGRWLLEAQAGQFYNQDRGVRLASRHWFGDNRVTLHYRNTASDWPIAMARTRFAGVELTLPFGPKASTTLGPATLRGRDQWAWGVESKVGSSDNALTSGYGITVTPRHGLLTDTLDYDRAGVQDMEANAHRIRAMLREQN